MPHDRLAEDKILHGNHVDGRSDLRALVHTFWYPSGELLGLGYGQPSGTDGIPPSRSKAAPKGCPIPRTGPGYVLLGCGLYYSVLIFNLGVTFWIKEPQQGMVGIMIYIPITILLILRLLGRLLPASSKIFISDPRLIR